MIGKLTYVYDSAISEYTSSDKNSADKIFGGQHLLHQLEILAVLSKILFKTIPIQKISADKVFCTKPYFRQFSLPNFCPIRYVVPVQTDKRFLNSVYAIFLAQGKSNCLIVIILLSISRKYTLFY